MRRLLFSTQPFRRPLANVTETSTEDNCTTTKGATEYSAKHDVRQ
ncbi:MAG: hypothetical protein CAPSK01_004657 [Candidatus Accumulibacter vicinus]|uniref:Uncharacterized protein n=1 Tax=Candidatus Accumulibacter vicinus TaxID=2954382 RepID=A0A084XUB0_9PROT|nr:MAG: hypothetical protein CAPSK01_004657 [Candidatus Accumulibacter vicinus]